MNQRGFLALGMTGYLAVAAGVVIAILGAAVAIQTKRIEAAREAASKCAAEDWRQLCLSWIDAVEKGTT